MGKVENTPKVDSLDAYSKDQWVDFLKQGAFRGLKINKVARHIGKSKSCTYDKATHELELIYGKGKTITLDMEKLLKKNERWTLSRLIHNIKMCVSTDYAKNFDIRIMKIAEAITKKTGNDFSAELEKFIDGDHNLNETKKLFDQNLKVINQSTGNADIQTNLLNLSAKVFEMADDANSRSLAFQIRCTAQAMVPDPNLVWEVLPPDIQRILLSEVGKNERTNSHPLNVVSKQFNGIASEVNKNWLTDDKISLKKEGCKTAKEAVQYIIDHQLTCANLLAFQDLNDADLNNLIDGCSNLKRISIWRMPDDDFLLLKLTKKFRDLQSLHIFKINFRYRGPFGGPLVEAIRDFSYGRPIVEAIRELSHLKRLELPYNGISGSQLIEITTMQPDIQSLGLGGWQDEISGRELLRSLGKLSDLKKLKIHDYKNLSGDQLVEIAKKHSGLQYLDLGATRGISIRKILKTVQLLPELHTLGLNCCYDLTGDQLVEIAKLLPLLEILDIRRCNEVQKDKLDEALLHLPKIRKVFTPKGEKLSI